MIILPLLFLCLVGAQGACGVSPVWPRERVGFRWSCERASKIIWDNCLAEGVEDENKCVECTSRYVSPLILIP